MNRRDFLQLTSGVGVALLVEACSAPAPAPKPTSAPAASGANGPLPTYIAQTGGPKPDFHSSDSRITDGFVNFPKDPQKSWSGGAPGAGGTLNVLVPAYYPVPTPRDQNAT